MKTFIVILALAAGYAWAMDLSDDCNAAVAAQSDAAFGKPHHPKPHMPKPRPITKPK